MKRWSEQRKLYFPEEYVDTIKISSFGRDSDMDIYKNPSSKELKALVVDTIPAVRGYADLEGNLYVINGINYVHEEFKRVAKVNDIYNYCIRNSKGVLLQSSNLKDFYLSSSYEPFAIEIYGVKLKQIQPLIQPILNKCKEKNPNLNFINKVIPMR